MIAHESIFEMQAELCQTMSHATRIRLVHTLRDGPQNVGDLAKALGLPSAKISQHLAILKTTGIVVAHRQGAEVFYQLTNPKIERICDLMREVLTEQAEQQSELIQALKER